MIYIAFISIIAIQSPLMDWCYLLWLGCIYTRVDKCRNKLKML